MRPRSVALLLAATLLTVCPSLVQSADTAAPAGKGKPIDVVICLDVSGSMEGLTAQARAKLWDLVNDFARVQPTPQLRVGLYSYGHTTGQGYDPKTGWVRKETDLTTDLDEVYKRLNGLHIDGGEEYVARVTRDALNEQKWSEDPKALKLVFVCGNEPVNQDPDVKLADVAKLAKSKGVLINTIYCEYGHPEEAKGWQDYAADCGGKFARIEHNRNIVQIQTPFDKQMAELNGKFNDTFVAYGKEGDAKKDNQAAQDKNAAASGAQVANSRLASKASALYRNSDWCLVCKSLEDPKFDITKVPVEELPEELKKLTPEKRVEYLNKKKAERADLQKKINDLNAHRQKFVDAEMKKHATEADKALDAALRSIVREQAAAKGIKVPE
ncbi:hypothetical protein AYO44_14660 [Planctomycetaceae bacterium SCGC AG-212-F19]|nr:hypothetical protein AYO44_14660 [Planctomycetaceae bacterium SCGC AG-212-F19]